MRVADISCKARNAPQTVNQTLGGYETLWSNWDSPITATMPSATIISHVSQTHADTMICKYRVEHTTVGHPITSPNLQSNGCRITIDRSPAIPLDWIGTMQKLPLRRRDDSPFADRLRRLEVQTLSIESQILLEENWFWRNYMCIIYVCIWLMEKLMVYND